MHLLRGRGGLQRKIDSTPQCCPVLNILLGNRWEHWLSGDVFAEEIAHLGSKEVLHVISAEDEPQRNSWIGRKLTDENSDSGSLKVIGRVMSGRDTMTEIKERKTCRCSSKRNPVHCPFLTRS